MQQVDLAGGTVDVESVVDLDKIGNGASHRRRGVAVRGRPVVNGAP
jgi:hypothetical protein